MRILLPQRSEREHEREPAFSVVIIIVPGPEPKILYCCRKVYPFFDEDFSFGAHNNCNLIECTYTIEVLPNSSFVQSQLELMKSN
jgi:hypothetical protein